MYKIDKGNIQEVVVTTKIDDYKILIGDDISTELVNLITRSRHATKILIVTDSTTHTLFSQKYTTILETTGLDIYNFSVDPGEESKSLSVYGQLLEYAAHIKLSRSDMIIALGGGVVGDLAGFAAGTYLRGIDFYQIPTTLLASVDSSVGGKTGINLSVGKNLAGVFWQARGVLCDISNMNTLSANVLADGISEMVKYGMICDPNLFDKLNAESFSQNLGENIKRCVEIKAEIVGKDETDRGRRQLLNFGHTMAHAIEKLSDYRISHGHAVAIGMVLISRASVNSGFCKRDVLDRLIGKLEAFGLPTETSFDTENMLDTAMSDKKISGDSINSVIPKSVGNCVIHPMKISEFKSFIRKGVTS